MSHLNQQQISLFVPERVLKALDTRREFLENTINVFYPRSRLIVEILAAYLMDNGFLKRYSEEKEE
jgi:hypothetical protein